MSVKETPICIIDDKGVVAARTDVSTDPDLFARFISRHAPEVERVVHESGMRAIWLTRELEKRGVPIICIDARLAHKALSGRINKSDQGDAEGLAQLAQTGWFSQGHIRSQASERVCVLMGARQRLIRMRKDLEGHVCGVGVDRNTGRRKAVQEIDRSWRISWPHTKTASIRRGGLVG